jgi:uncharacterized protein DUF5666
MNWKKYLMYCAVAAAVSITSCSGPKNACTTNCGPAGNATLNVTLYDTPPTGVSLLSFSLPIVGISLTPSTGSDVSIYSPTTIVPTELTRLETDSALIVSGASVATGSYTAIKITIGASSGVFINTSGSTITWNSGANSCLNGAVCQLPTGGATTVTVPLTVTLSSNVTQWIGLNVNLNNAIVTTGGIGVDFSQASVFAATTTVRTGIPSGDVDTIQDFTGSVTALSSSSITVKSSLTGQTITAAITSNTAFDEAPSTYSKCGGTASSACVTTGSIVSLDTALSNTGTITATEIDVLDATATDEVEGVIYPTTTANVVGLILADKTSASGNAILGASTTTYGTGIFLAASSTINYVVDTKTLTPIFTPIGFAGSGDLLAGQVVRAQVSNITSDSAGIHATATNVLLRSSRLTGTVILATGSNFNFTPPSYVSTFNTGLVPPLVAYTFVSNTSFDGITDASGITTGSTVSIRALFLNNAKPTFAVAKVRVP